MPSITSPASSGRCRRGFDCERVHIVLHTLLIFRRRSANAGLTAGRAAFWVACCAISARRLLNKSSAVPRVDHPGVNPPWSPLDPTRSGTFPCRGRSGAGGQPRRASRVPGNDPIPPCCCEEGDEQVCLISARCLEDLRVVWRALGLYSATAPQPVHACGWLIRRQAFAHCPRGPAERS